MMELNTKKCQVITISRKRNKIHHQHCLNITPLAAVNSTKYLGITITSDLKWNQHTSNICQKVNNTLAFLRRNLRINSPDLKATAYKALVRPLVEYCSTVWDPSTSGVARIYFRGAVKITCEGEGEGVGAFCILMLLMVQFGACFWHV